MIVTMAGANLKAASCLPRITQHQISVARVSDGHVESHQFPKSSAAHTSFYHRAIRASKRFLVEIQAGADAFYINRQVWQSSRTYGGFFSGVERHPQKRNSG